MTPADIEHGTIYRTLDLDSAYALAAEHEGASVWVDSVPRIPRYDVVVAPWEAADALTCVEPHDECTAAETLRLISEIDRLEDAQSEIGELLRDATWLSDDAEAALSDTRDKVAGERCAKLNALLGYGWYTNSAGNIAVA